MYLLDTNTVIYFLKASLPEAAMPLMNTVVDEHCNLSAITKIELLGFEFTSAEEQQIMETFVAGSTIIALDDAIVNKAIELRKLKKTKLPDTIIAATAIVYNFTLITRNTSDFLAINTLQLLNPWELT